MTVKLKSLLVDLDRETKGDWVPSIDIQGVEFNVSSLHLPAYRIDLQLLEQRLARQYKGRPVPPPVRTVEIGKLIFKHLLHDWRGFDEPYSKETAQQMLCAPEGRDFVAAVESCAAALSIRDHEFVEEAAKNSKASSAAG